MSGTDQLSPLLVSWAFATDVTVLDEQSLKAAKKIVVRDPKNMIANAFVALAYLGKGMCVAAKVSSSRCRDYFTAIITKGTTLTDEILKSGDDQINLSTLCLIASVMHGALTMFSGVPITDMLTSTQEAVRRAAGAAGMYAIQCTY